MKALLVIDLQEGYVEKYDNRLLSYINKRIQDAVINHEVIIYIKNTKKLRSGDKTNRLAEQLKVCSKYIICKKSASAFSNDDLLDILKQNQVTDIEIVGIDGNSCIACSAMDALRYGYRVVLPCTYIGVQNAERFEKSCFYQKSGIVIL